MQQQKKIPLINEKFDLPVFAHIIRRSIIWCIIIFSLLFLGAYTYLRYTPPLYVSSSVLQVNEGKSTDKILQIESVYESVNISHVIELLRSKEFLKRIFNKLPMQVSYYLEGTFLTEEQYKSAPYIIEYKNVDSRLYNLPIYFTSGDEGKCNISFDLGEKPYNLELNTDSWTKTDFGEIYIKINDLHVIKELQDDLKKTRQYFIVNNPEMIYEKNIKNLDVQLLNQSAQT
ncbi:MAG: Wzz/FepE/Etk N-terminal domain-containing protein, partial [Bacteroidota bacterium]